MIAAVAVVFLWATVGRCAIVVNEVMYHPGASNTAGDWFELYNSGPGPVDLSGYSFSAGVTLTFPAATVLGAGQYLVIASDKVAFDAYYSSFSGVSIQVQAGNLSNSGESVVLVNASLAEVDRVDFLDVAPWNTRADGSGPSLELINPGTDNNLATSWTAGSDDGTPGAQNSVFASVGPSITNVDLAPDNPLAGSETRVRARVQASGALASVALFFDAHDGQGVRSRQMSFVNFDGSATAHPFRYQAIVPPQPAQTIVDYYIRAEDASGQVTFLPPTAPGTEFKFYVEETHPEAESIVINEIMYRAGGASPLEFIELYNATFEKEGQGRPINLSNWTLEAAGGSFRIPLGTRLLAGRYLVVTNGQSLLQSTYGGGIPAVGDFPLSLGNTGGQVRILAANGKEIDAVEYSSSAPWPASAAGSGPSAELIAPTRGNNNGANWAAGLPTGSPGRRNGSFDSNEAPHVSAPSHSPQSPTSGSPVVFRAKATDDTGVASVVLHYDDNGDSNFSAQAMSPVGGDFYETSISFPSGTTIHYYFSAIDGGANPRSDLSPGNAPAESYTAFVSDSHPVPGSVVLNELMYHDSNPALNLEFVELKNTTGAAINVGGWEVSENDDRFFIPPGTSISAGGYLTIAGSLSNLISAYGPIANSIGNLTFDLDNIGEDIFLKDPNGAVIDSVNYGDGAPWPTLADGDGPSMERIDAAADGNLPQSWASSLAPAGTPGANNSLALDPASSLVITEIMYHPIADESTSEFFEIYNRGGSSLDLSGWKVHEGVNFTFPPATILGSGQYAVVARNPAAVTAKYNDVFAANSTLVLGPFTGALSNSGDRITIVNPIAGQVKDLIYYEDGGDWPVEADGEGSSLELVNPDADNSGPANWAPSSRNTWQKVSVTDEVSGGSPRLTFFLAGAGTVLVDDVSLYNEQAAASVPLSNSGFAASIASWNPNAAMPYATYAHNATEGLSGAGCLSMTYTATPDRYNMIGGMSQITSATGGTFHTLTFWFKVTSGNPILYYALVPGVLDTSSDMNPGIMGLVSIWEKATPGYLNSRALADPPPFVHDLKHSPKTPEPGAIVTFTAEASDNGAIDEIRLFADLDGNGSIVEGTEFLVMHDDGVLGDEIAGDGKWTAQIDFSALGLASQTVVRYYVKATDNASLPNVTRHPLATAVNPTEALFLYSASEPAFKVPRYFLQVSADAIDRLDANTFYPETDGDQNIHWDDDEPGTFIAREEGDDGYTVFDNCRVRYKGGPFTRLWDKKNWKIRFPKGHKFNGADTLNINSSYYSIPGGAFRRSGRENDFMSNTLFGETGHPHNHEEFIRLEIDRNLGTGFQPQGLFLATEQLDANFLKRVGRDDKGTFYKADGFDSNYLGDGLQSPDLRYGKLYTKEANQEASNADLIAMLTAVNTLSGSALSDYFKTNFDINSLANFYALYSCIQHFDGTFHNHMFYHDVNGDGLWEVFPFDIDRSWGVIMGYKTWATDPFEGTHPYYTTFRSNHFMTNFLNDDAMRAQYYAQLSGVLDNVFTEEHLGPIIDSLFERLGDASQGEIHDDIQLWRPSPLGLGRAVPDALGNGFTTDYDIGGVGLRDYVRRRGAYLRSLLPSHQVPPASPEFTIQAESHQTSGGAGVAYGATLPAAGSDGAISYIRFAAMNDFANYVVVSIPAGEYRATLHWAKNGTGSTDLLYRSGTVSTAPENNLSLWNFAGSFTGRTGFDRDYAFTPASRSVFIPVAGTYTFKLVNKNQLEPGVPATGVNRTLAKLDYFTLDKVSNSTSPPAGTIKINDADAVRKTPLTFTSGGEGILAADVGNPTPNFTDFVADDDTDYTPFNTASSGLSGAGGWLEFDVNIPAGSYRPVFRGSSSYDSRALLSIDGQVKGMFLGSDTHGNTNWVDSLIGGEVITVATSGVHNVRISEADGTAFFNGASGLGNTYLAMKYVLLVPVADSSLPDSSASSPFATRFSPIPVNYTANEPGGSLPVSVRLYYRYMDGPWTDSGLALTNLSSSFAFVPSLGEGVYGFLTRATDAAANAETFPQIADAQTLYDVSPPTIACPGNLVIEDPATSIPVADSRIASFLNSVAASDNFTASPTVTNDAPSTFPAGTTIVTFTATDAAGNAAVCSATIRVDSSTKAGLDWTRYR